MRSKTRNLKMFLKVQDDPDVWICPDGVETIIDHGTTIVLGMSSGARQRVKMTLDQWEKLCVEQTRLHNEEHR